METSTPILPKTGDPVEFMVAERERWARGYEPDPRVADIIAEKPDMEIADLDGKLTNVTELWTRMQRELEHAKDIAPLHEVAVRCILRAA
jgi:hypothetical protein